jgi:hypothetical protein
MPHVEGSHQRRLRFAELLSLGKLFRFKERRKESLKSKLALELKIPLCTALKDELKKKFLS